MLSHTKEAIMPTKKKSKIEVFTCKYCGRKEHSIQSLVSGTCPKRKPTGKCVPYKGGKNKSTFTCGYCGKIAWSLSDLTSRSCNNSPSGWCVPY